MNAPFEIDTSLKQLETFITEELGLLMLARHDKPLIGTNYKVDCTLILQMGKYEIPVFVEVKGEVTSLKQIQKFVELVKPLYGIGLLVADSIDLKVKEHLKENGLGYFDTSNDLFLPLKFKLESEYTDKVNFNESIMKRKGFKAESNLKILIYFLSKPTTLRYTQRQLAINLDLSLGTVNKALANLDKLKLIISRRKTRYIGQFEEIVNRFRISFLDIEERKMSLGRFSPINDEFYEQWNKVDIKKLNSYWGGEAAASIRTKYLSPELYRLYTYNDQVSVLLKELRLKKDPNGKIEIFKAFWPDEINNQDGTIPDFLTYCELINSGIDRNVETSKILEEKIKKELGKYVY
jgi:hypothetical protein